ncbi:MAG TPA: hypothetical protein PLG31_13890, partial [Spirochaetota bacterium]|nr:hypothetical protein [Spirochaetota bacterium]
MRRIFLVAVLMMMTPAFANDDANERLLGNSRNGSVPGIRMALKDGAKINEAHDHEYNTALMLAAGGGHLEAVKVLVD